MFHAARRALPVRHLLVTSNAHAGLATGGSFVVGSCRSFFQRTPARQLEYSPAASAYVMSPAFDEPSMRFLCEGADVDFKQEVRGALEQVLPPPPTNFTACSDADVAESSQVSRTLQMLRALGRFNLVTYAQVRSTPHRLASFYETLATANPALAVLAADHYTFAGMIATHGCKELQQKILSEVDTGGIIGCLATRELIAEGAPLNTEARYDADEKCFVLRGTGKFMVPAAACADWAILTATLTTKKAENHGVHAFAVPLKEKGVLLQGVSVRSVGGENAAVSASGTGIIHFDNVRLPKAYLLHPFCMEGTDIQYRHGEEGLASAVEVLRCRSLIASGAIYVGMMKKLLSDLVHHVADKNTVGSSGRRNHPYFGIQHVQTPLVCLVAKFFVYLLAWQRILPLFTNAAASRPPSYEDDMHLEGVVHFLQESIVDLHRYAETFVGPHSPLHSTSLNAAMTVVHLRQEGVELSTPIRKVAFKSITKNIGTTHWGWWLTNLLRMFPMVDRFIKNPLYSPRIADLGRHLIFFRHKHYTLKKRLRQSRERERRQGGSEHQWYDWVMFRHQQVLHCGEAFMEMHFLEVMMEATHNCADACSQKILRDVGWIYALARQVDRMDFLLATKMLSPNKSVILSAHLDNLTTVLAPQCVNLVDAMQVPESFRAPYGKQSMEAYWSVPGTNAHIERGQDVVLHKDKAYANSKAGQEAMREEDTAFDLFHGLADKPSYAHKE